MNRHRRRLVGRAELLWEHLRLACFASSQTTHRCFSDTKSSKAPGSIVSMELTSIRLPKDNETRSQQSVVRLTTQCSGPGRSKSVAEWSILPNRMVVIVLHRLIDQMATSWRHLLEVFARPPWWVIATRMGPNRSPFFVLMTTSSCKLDQKHDAITSGRLK